VGRAFGATLFMTLLALIFVLLKRHTGQGRIAVGTPVSLRDRPELQDLVGMFLTMTVVDVDMTDEPALGDLLRRVRTRSLDSLAHRRLPFKELARAVQHGRDLSRNPVFQVMVQLSEVQDLELPGIIAAPFDLDPGTAQFDLSVHLFETGGGLRGFIEYDTDLFDERTMTGLRDRLLTLLGPDRLAPGQPISRLRLIGADEEERILRLWNRTASDYPKDATLARLVEAQAAATPERAAVRAGSDELSYGELNARANRLARHLQRQGLGPGVFAGICMRRGIDMVVAVLAVLKAGGAYLPLDPSFPRERLDFVIEDSGAPIVITNLGEAAPFERAGRQVVDLDPDERFEAEDDADLTVENSSRDLAYLIYTSGSTGRPKGVQIEHRSVVNFLHAMRAEPGLEADDRLLAVTTLSFDISVLEIFLPLTTGALVVVADQDSASDGELLKGLIASSRATVMQATPATWRMLLESGWRDDAGMKKLVGGEAVPGALADALAGMPGALWNMYGPTETTIWSAVRRLRPGEEVRVGGPIANTRFYVIDANLVPVPEGVPGELLIGGDGVAPGYWRRDELTAERFIEDPFEPGLGGRLYRTGDLVRLKADGSLSVLGRLDRQVKVRGFRIELGDIEQTVLGAGLVKDALVVTGNDPAGETILVAYLIEHPDRPLVVDALRGALREKLPHYMIPSAFVTLEAWPLTPNGKVDHKRLPAPERRRSTT
ncbi:MAG: amino acid adenylation domain-containing protein, partial [Geminicoccaceae bacterium]|nr:amino acid adenylation domain-containing protein [Geminicoccaceae bacterium]